MELVGVSAQGGVVLLDKVPANLVLGNGLSAVRGGGLGVGGLRSVVVGGVVGSVGLVRGAEALALSVGAVDRHGRLFSGHCTGSSDV